MTEGLVGDALEAQDPVGSPSVGPPDVLQSQQPLRGGHQGRDQNHPDQPDGSSREHFFLLPPAANDRVESHGHHPVGPGLLVAGQQHDGQDEPAAIEVGIAQQAGPGADAPGHTNQQEWEEDHSEEAVGLRPVQIGCKSEAAQQPGKETESRASQEQVHESKGQDIVGCDVGIEGRLSNLPGQKREDQVTRVEHSRLQLANESGSPEAGKVPQGHRETVPALDELLQPGIGLNRSVEAPGQRSLAQEDRPEVVAEKDKSADSQIGEERLQSLQVVPILAHRLFEHQPFAIWN